MTHQNGYPATLTPTEYAVLRARLKQRARNRNAIYRDDPVGYARDVLGVNWWTKQVEIADALLRSKRIMVRAGNSVGKTFWGGSIINWFFDTRDPGIALTTAPTERQVVDLLWSEVRSQRGSRPGLMPKAPRMESGAKHYAAGYTARDVNAFQGAHEESLIIGFDEAVGIHKMFWTAADGMLTSGDDNLFFAIYNPTDPTSMAYEKEQSGHYEVITISPLEHPNIIAELAGKPPPYPKAVRLSWISERIEEWCEPIAAEDATASDTEWPPGSGQWFRPGPEFESRVMALWPTSAANSVWSEAAFTAAVKAAFPEPNGQPFEIGCDVARFGDDETVIHVRRGPCSFHHEWHNGWPTDRTAGRLKELAREYGQRCDVDGRKIVVKVDDDGVGGGVIDQQEGFTFVPVSAAAAAIESERYPNRRSELWFAVANRANRDRNLDLSRLSRAAIQRLRTQCMAPRWRQDSQGRRVVEPKDKTKERIGRSPDDADALNLAYAVQPKRASRLVSLNWN